MKDGRVRLAAAQLPIPTAIIKPMLRQLSEAKITSFQARDLTMRFSRRTGLSIHNATPTANYRTTKSGNFDRWRIAFSTVVRSVSRNSSGYMTLFCLHQYS